MERSNWTWDPIAEQYFWHRFHSHQPDLNFDNLAVHKAVFDVCDFWMCMFAMPGTPIVSYGDEIGMGDNVHLGDRNGVRMPMQWSGDRDAGFSRANPQKLFLPAIIDPEYHYETVNVESQLADPSSLLWWTKRLIALRKRYPVFGSGDIRFLHPSNPRVLAFTRSDAQHTILVVANLSRFVQPVEVPLAEHEGLRLIELFGSIRELAPKLADHCVSTGFTHVELLPIMEHPFYSSWGYQTTGYFAPTSKFGTPQDFMGFVDNLHQRGVGVVLDWVPSHFPTDEHGLGYFDGTHLFEHEDRRQGFHPDWKSAIFNYGRPEVRAFLISSAMFWLGRFHADAIRVDAVASVLYLHNARKHAEWIPNPFGGRENIEAVEFLRRLNTAIYGAFPDVQTIAEESAAWPMVSRPAYVGGLGFGLKWDMCATRPRMCSERSCGRCSRRGGTDSGSVAVAKVGRRKCVFAQSIRTHPPRFGTLRPEDGGELAIRFASKDARGRIRATVDGPLPLGVHEIILDAANTPPLDIATRAGTSCLLGHARHAKLHLRGPGQPLGHRAKRIGLGLEQQRGHAGIVRDWRRRRSARERATFASGGGGGGGGGGGAGGRGIPTAARALSHVASPPT